MASPRIPPTEITGPLGGLVRRAARRQLGRVPESLGVMWHNPKVLMTSPCSAGRSRSGGAPTAELRLVAFNGSEAVQIVVGDETHTAVSLVVESGRITHVHAMRNPDELRRLDQPVHLTR